MKVWLAVSSFHSLGIPPSLGSMGSPCSIEVWRCVVASARLTLEPLRLEVETPLLGSAKTILDLLQAREMEVGAVPCCCPRWRWSYPAWATRFPRRWRQESKSSGGPRKPELGKSGRGDATLDIAMVSGSKQGTGAMGVCCSALRPRA